MDGAIGYGKAAMAAWAIGTMAALATSHVQAAPASGNVTVELSADRIALSKGDDVVVTVTLTNHADTTQFVLAWQTPLLGVQAPLFDVLRDGQRVPYLGIQAKRPAPGPGDYIALAPGASRAERVELSALYDMRVTGAYSVRYRADALQVFTSPGVMQSTAEAPGFATSLWIDGRLPRGTLPSPVTPAGPASLTYSRCSNAQQDIVASAVQAARAMSTDADAYLGHRTLGARYTTWFGAIDRTQPNTVVRHFRAIRDAFATKPVTVDCGCTESYYAYVYPNQPYKIYVCNAFWTAPVTGTDSKGGTLVHEMSHFTVVAGTNDWVYGQAAATNLALTDQAKAVDNADSHEYFGENTPPQQ